MQEKKLNIRYLKGVGPKRAELLGRLGIKTVEDILYYLPRRYEDRSKFTLIKDVKVGEHQLIRGKVLKTSTYVTKGRSNIFQISLADKTGIIYCVWFNQSFLKDTFKIDQDIIVYGKVEKYKRLQINHPDYEVVKNDSKSFHMGRIVPVYSLTQDISHRYLRFLTNEAIRDSVSKIKETLPSNLIARKHLVDLKFAIRNIHFPESFANLEKAYRRLVFEEFFVLQLALAVKRKHIRTHAPGILHQIDSNLFESFKKLFNFELTKSQIRTINEVQADMASKKPMNRLLEGDVGSGKTIVAAYAALFTVKNGYQASFMAPTEILARQHYITLSELFMPLGINIRLLVSGLEKSKKQEIKEEISKGEVDIVVGTHAVIWEDVIFRKLGLVVIDEQHKFGVTQRQLLRNKSANPHVLVMTATPIPRTLALTIYGDLDISVIRELPKGRRPINTYCVEEDKRREVYKFLEEEVKKGRQGYIVYPRIWSSEESGVKAATFMYNKLQDEIFPELKLGLLHGKKNRHPDFYNRNRSWD